MSVVGHQLGEPLPRTSDSAFLQAFNDALEIRRLTDRLNGRERQALAAVRQTQRAA